MKIIIVNDDIIRPSVEIQEIKQSDGSYLAGSHYWCVVEFMTDAPRGDVVGSYDNIRIYVQGSDKEIWEFSNAIVMLHSRDVGLRKEESKIRKYVLAYDGVKRMGGK